MNRDANGGRAEQTRQYQLLKLREITKLAYEKQNSTMIYLIQLDLILENLNSLDDLKKLPIIDKQVVMENLDEMCTKPVTGRDVDFISTGGTSGMPLHFYINANRSSIEYAYLTVSWERIGYKVGMPMAGDYAAALCILTGMVCTMNTIRS